MDMRHPGFAISLLCAALLATGCASFDGRGLEPGKSRQSDVEALMGAPSYLRALGGGDVALYYSRLPEGREVYVVTVASDGVVRSIEQRLVRRNFAKIAAGASKQDDVRQLLGLPGREGRLERQARTWWEYKYFDYFERRILWVQFSDDGVVREVLDMFDWEYDKPGAANGATP